MRILFDNINFNSRSGPNSFGKKLRDGLLKLDHDVRDSFATGENPDVSLSFIINQKPTMPNVLRLDGIYFNTSQDFNALNDPIRRSYIAADTVVFQSKFNQHLTERYFGSVENTYIIGNGVDINYVQSVRPIENKLLDKFSDVWCCASSWRPHKRLKDNIEYFLSVAPNDACLVIAGSNPDHVIKNERIMYTGGIPHDILLSIYRRSSTFIHLAWLDHCPNVVVDARAAGCKIICSDSGGTKEIAGHNATLLKESVEWAFNPIALYSPPDLDFSRTVQNTIASSIEIETVAEKYLNVFSETIKRVQK